MKPSKIIALLAAPVIFSFLNYSCKKENADSEKPVINISIPQANQSFKLNGDSVHVMLSASDNIELKSLVVELKTSSGTTWFSESPDVNSQNYFIYHKHYNPVGLTGSTSLVLSVLATDGKGNTANKSLNFSVTP